MKNLIIIFFVFAASIYANAQTNDLIYLKDGKFMKGCNDYYPVCMNYLINIWYEDNEYYIGPDQHFFNDNVNCTDADDCLDAIEAHLAMIKHMSFNTVRVVGFNVFSDDTLNGSLGYDLNRNKTILNPNQYNNHFNLIEKFLNKADTLGLKVILHLGSGGIEIGSASTTYKNYLKQLVVRFASNPTIMAYDLYNEPCMFAKGQYSKLEVYQFVKNWYDTIRTYSPNQLVTIGLSYPYEAVMRWDPAVMNVDFLSYHPYGFYRVPPDSLGVIEHYIDEAKGYIKWYSMVTEKPWIIGETGFSGNANHPLPYSEGNLIAQANYADSTLKMTRDCGGKGYSWWFYQDVAWQDVSTYMGLMTRRYGTGIFPTTTFSERDRFNNLDTFTVDGIVKPAQEKFDTVNFKPFQIGTCPSVASFNYFNPRNHDSIQLYGRVYGPNSQPLENAVVIGAKEIGQNSFLYYKTYTNSDGYYYLYTDSFYSEPIKWIRISAYGKSNIDVWNDNGFVNYTCTLSNYAVPPVLDIADYDIVIPTGANLSWSFPRFVYKNLILSANSTLTIYSDVFLNETSQLILEPGATLILENGSNLSAMCPSNKWQGLLHVKENAELLVMGGSTIRMGGTGTIFIDSTNSQTGQLTFMNNANIILTDYTTKLEIKGKLRLMPQAHFFTQGRGYVRFSSTLSDSQCYNIFAQSNTSMTFNGEGQNHKKLEIAQPSLYTHGVNGVNAVKYISFANCKVVMSGSNSRLSLYRANDGSINLNNVTITSSTGNRTGHRGIALYGQTNITIQNSVFSNGLYGIHAMLNYTDGAPLTLTNCAFYNNDRGLNVNDKGITLNYCTFDGNGYGVYADGMTFSSESNYSSYIYSTNDGINYTSASTGGLYVLYPLIMNNSNNGIAYSGATKLSVRCGDVRSNYKGITFSNNASLNMSQNESPIGGRVRMSVNTENNIYASNGNLLFLNSGYNNLQRNTNKMVISGNLGGYSACPTYLPAQYNRWNSSNTSPVYGADYSLIHNGTCRLKQIYLTDNTPTYATCSAPPPLFAGGDNSFASTSVINTQNYNNISLSNAVADIVGLTESGNFYIASDRLYEILNYPLLSSSAADNYYLNKAYLYMKQNMASIIQTLVSDTAVTAQNTLSNYAGKLRIIQNKIINQSQNNAAAYNTYFYTSLDKALLYRALYQYDNALLNLNNILNWVTPAYTDEVNKWLCLTQLEKDVLDSIVRKEDFFELKQLCENMMSLKTTPNSTYDDSQNDTLQNENDKLSANLTVHEIAFIKVTPNPLTNQSVIETFIPEFEKQAVIKVLDMLGRPVCTFPVANAHSRITISNSSLKEGVYYFVLIKDDVILDKVRVVFMKE